MMVWVIVALSGLLVWQQFFWMRHTQKLVDKLMSRDFADYKQQTTPRPVVPRGTPIEQPDEDMGVMEQIGLR